jgi:predicted ArsR family transcriptional regulator
MTYPITPGARDRDTSVDAAESMASRAETLRTKALGVFSRADGLTADEAAFAMNASILAIRPRVTELARMGEIEDTGRRRKNRSGRSAIVWETTG